MSRSPSFSVKPELSLKPDPESLKRWIHAFCIMRFDLEQGQLLEECYPPGCLSQEEEIEVSFNSFPDSVSQHHNRSSIHDCIFFFRFRRPKKNAEERDGSDKYLYGYVFNRQRHDERLKRGGEQKSVVILSHTPYSSVFRPLLQIIGPLYFDVGNKAIQHIAGYVSMWPAPVPGKLMELPIGNAMLKVNLPPAHSLPLENGVLYEESSSSMAPLLPTNQSVPQGLFHDADLFGIYRGLLLQLWTLWELLLIGEPILIIAPTPPQCSEAVACLVSMVAPLFCSVDFRPYFTIHDPGFARLNSLREGDTFPPMVLGVTNLFFLKALRNIPHVVSVGTPAPIKLRRDGPLCLMTEHKEAVWTTYSAITKPDTSILNRLIDAGMSPRVEESMSVVNNEILRRHFLELTTNFLAPFGPYFQVNAPSDGTSPYVTPPSLPSFGAEEFLSNLSGRGVGKFLSKRMKSNWPDLYRRFLQGPNFMPWFQRRRAVAEQEQRRLWRLARMKTDMRQITSQMNELEAVDSFNAIEKHINEEVKARESGGGGADLEGTFQKLKKDLQAVFSVLPRDMQQLLLLNPQRASLLQDPSDLQ
ncbi:PREDICTED: protein DENND6A [Camelina sativa]|uniref:Protein DENND6A n=1 Tax=Camelina sativa TaxID=90675 RepID=A0ABM0WPR3_CAMSA|nr:PREDICTED: protein DENND6A [Camelina sativa]